MAEVPPPLMLCMENTVGEEVAVSVDPEDDFHTFLEKTKSILGYDVDINSITRNQPVSLNDNIYQFILNNEQNLSSDLELATEEFHLTAGVNTDGNNDLVYILDDGTQINTSQIHFDNEDPLIDLTAENIPFVKYTDDGTHDAEIENVESEDVKKINLVGSPVSHWSSHNSTSSVDFVNSLPFRLVCNNTSGFEAQFTKYLQSSAKTYTTLDKESNTNLNTSPKSLIKENYKNHENPIQDNKNPDDFTAMTREEILNMLKDSPVASLPYENTNEKRKHIRKTHPSRVVSKDWNSKPISYIDVDGTLISETESQNCFVCGLYIDNNVEKLYLFDNEDQRLYRSSPQRKPMTKLKIICEQCLVDNFRLCHTKGSNQSLNQDEYLVIRNNQQYIFQKNNSIDLKGIHSDGLDDAKAIVDKIETDGIKGKDKDKMEYVKVEIGSDGEIVTKPIDNDIKSDDVILVKDGKNGSSSDVEIIETGPEIDDIIDNLDEADEEVKEFLGKYHRDEVELKELKCRFCFIKFVNVPAVIEHGETHKHEMDDGAVYPCPLCDYGYRNFKWLKGHLKAAHDREQIDNKNDMIEEGDTKDHKSVSSKENSPIAKRTRSANRRNETEKVTENPEKPPEDTKLASHKGETTIQTIEAKTEVEVKREVSDSSDDGSIWIVHTADDEADKQLRKLLHSVKDTEIKNEENDLRKTRKCRNCGQIFVSTENASGHKCRRRGRKRKCLSKEGTLICQPTAEALVKRSQGRLKQVDEPRDDLLVARPRKKRRGETSSDPQIVTCHDCNESFTSKVRLKFHINFCEAEGQAARVEPQEMLREGACAEESPVQFLANLVCVINGLLKRQFHEPTAMMTSNGQYTCVECDKAIFTTETELFDHVHFQHGKPKRWQCTFEDCGKTFYLRATLTKHSRIHTDTRRYVCVTCGKRFLDKQTLDEHGVTHLQIKPFQCHICLKQLTRRSRLRMHLRAHEEELSPKLVLVCCVCGRAFRDHTDAQEHATKSTECIETFANELKVETEEPSLQLSPTSGLVRHTVHVVESRLSGPIPRQVSNSRAEPLLSELSDESRSIVRVVEIEKAFRCEYCEDVFYLEDGLNSHRAIHKDVKNPFTCHICKVSFATYSRCTTHKTTHGFYKRSLADAKKRAEKSSENQRDVGASAIGILGYGGFPVVKHFLCEDCGRSYLHWTYLQVHRRMKHTDGNFLYKCNQCELTFPNSWSLAYHRKKVHAKIAQEDSGGNTKTVKGSNYRIPCRDCDEILPNKTALYKHRKKEHSDKFLQSDTKEESTSSTRVVACATCGESFPNTYALHLHVREFHRAPRSHVCPVCAHAFRTASVLNEHLRIHTGERPYPCDICGAAFRRSTAMRNHRLIHTGVRAWACARCPKRFRVRSDLRTHYRLKHPVRVIVIEMSGLNPSPEEVLDQLKKNNISQDKVIEITKMSFTKGSSSVIPNSLRALSMLSDVEQTEVELPFKPSWNHHENIIAESFAPARRGRGISRNPRRPIILQGDCDVRPQLDLQDSGLAIDVNQEDLSDLNVQLLLHCVTTDGGQQIVNTVQLDDNTVLQ